MIDTDKYEGHDNWEGTKVNMANEANKLLIADAPLLLEEVKRLRHELLLILSDFETKKTDIYEMRNRIETILKGGEEE